MTHEDIQTEINKLLGQDDLSHKLREALEKEVNSRISWKARERMSSNQYFERRGEEENQIIESGFLSSIFENATLSEVEALTPTFLSKKTLMHIIIAALKMYIDNEQENDPKCQALHGHYLTLKNILSSEIPFESGDGFLDYLASKDERIELEQARETGNICIQCGSRNVRSKGKEWQCNDCGKRFRKH